MTMKIAFVTDTHFGVRQDSPVFLGHAKRFFTDQFFPYCVKHGVEHVFHLGDVVDRPHQGNFNTLQTLQDCLIRPLIKHDISSDILTGNHDVYHKNTPDVNSLRAIFEHHTFPSIVFHWEPTIVERGGMRFALAPWATTSRFDAFKQFLWTADAPWLVGHLEIQTFMLNAMRMAETGLQPADFHRYEWVLSGHFHMHQTAGNITFVGAPYQMRWDDFGHDHGFMVLDTRTKKLTRIVNPVQAYHKLYFTADRQDPIPSELDGRFTQIISDGSVKLRKKLEKYVATVTEGGAVCEVMSSTMSLTPETPLQMEHGDTRTFIADYVNSLTDIPVERRGKILGVLNDAHDKAVMGA
jgi:DNA repair exonuclease SbcCD nuclease subunit